MQYVWHPAIEAILWVSFWTLFAASTGVVWDFLVNGSLHADRVLARAVVVLLALALLTIVVFLMDLLGGLAQHAWDNYPWRLARNIIAVLAMVFLAAATTYVLWMIWLLKRAWPHVRYWFRDIQWATEAHRAGPSDLTTWAFLIAINAALLWFAFSIWRGDPWYSYRHALGVLGLRKWIIGVCLMAYLRLLVPRRDFFIHAPLVSWMRMLAVATLVHTIIPIRMFAVSTPVLIVITDLPMWIGALAPPLWIYLGASEFDSFRMFYEIRSRWRRHGLTLLDRTNTGGQQFYTAWRSSMGASSVFYDPGIARIWSLRTRPRLWQTAVRLLAAFVPVVVVDRRYPSEIVEFEVTCLERRGFLNKVWMVVSTESERMAGPSVTDAKLVDEETLMSSHWTDKGLSFLEQ